MSRIHDFLGVFFLYSSIETDRQSDVEIDSSTGLLLCSVHAALSLSLSSRRFFFFFGCRFWRISAAMPDDDSTTISSYYDYDDCKFPRLLLSLSSLSPRYVHPSAPSSEDPKGLSAKTGKNKSSRGGGGYHFFFFERKEKDAASIPERGSYRRVRVEILAMFDTPIDGYQSLKRKKKERKKSQLNCVTIEVVIAVICHLSPLFFFHSYFFFSLFFCLF